ncbi:MAG: hypothetical protein K9M82_07020 [Deltaproteobacteria bacterium]|nr:hypothetical protein [Deltaproteobacteria bacterium]
MKAGILFSGTGPILVLTTHDTFADPGFIKKLEAKGIQKFLVFEVPEDEVKKRYGKHFNVVMGDLYQEDDLRVLDYNGHNIFHNFRLSELGPPVYHEPD